MLSIASNNLDSHDILYLLKNRPKMKKRLHAPNYTKKTHVNVNVSKIDRITLRSARGQGPNPTAWVRAKRTGRFSMACGGLRCTASGQLAVCTASFLVWW